MARLDVARLSDKMADIRESLQALREYAQWEEERFLAGKEAIRAARYCFIVMAEAATAIATHICARLLRKAPGSYAESFALLAEGGLIEPALAKRLGRMAGFRNLMVYGYNKVDNQRMWQIMRSDLGDLDAYLEAVAALPARARGEAE
ncbi:MAG: type VII toxin-antitoxin system HepT family RNase toxin [Desulfotomaculales bacterium]